MANGNGNGRWGQSIVATIATAALLAGAGGLVSWGRADEKIAKLEKNDENLAGWTKEHAVEQASDMRNIRDRLIRQEVILEGLADYFGTPKPRDSHGQ